MTNIQNNRAWDVRFAAQDNSQTLLMARAPGSRNGKTVAFIAIMVCCFVHRISLVNAAIFSFEDLATNTPLSGLPEWTVSSPDNFPDAPLSWITEYDSGSGTLKAAAIGGYYDVPISSSYSATLALSEPLLHGALVSFDVAIFDSTNLFPDRDTFGFSVNSLLGSPFLSVLFTPVGQTLTPEADPSALWRVSYAFRGGSTVTTDLSFVENAMYNISLLFGPSDMIFRVNDGFNIFDFTGLPSGYSPGTDEVSGLAFNWSLSTGNTSFGDNYMIIDNVVSIPEPGRILFMGMGCFALVFRRRRKSSMSV